MYFITVSNNEMKCERIEQSSRAQYADFDQCQVLIKIKHG